MDAASADAMAEEVKLLDEELALADVNTTLSD